jgi:hypothetical protein
LNEVLHTGSPPSFIILPCGRSGVNESPSRHADAGRQGGPHFPAGDGTPLSHDNFVFSFEDGVRSGMSVQMVPTSTPSCSLKYLFNGYIQEQNACYPKSIQVILPGAARNGFELKFLDIELNPSNVSEADFGLKKGSVFLNKD